MKNRAKCKLCESIIESFHDTDYVICKCGHITVSGGQKMECSAIDWANFLRVDDQGNVIIVHVKERDVKPLDNGSKPSKEDLLKMLDEMIEGYEKLPDQAKYSPVNHYDMLSALLLVSSIFKS
jgi:hypothetical protein